MTVTSDDHRLALARELSEMARRIRECRSDPDLNDRERECMGSAAMHLNEAAEGLRTT